MAEHKYTLKEPIKDLAGNEIRELTIRDNPKIGDYLKAARFAGKDATDTVEGAYLIAALCGLEPMEFDSLGMEDFGELSRLANLGGRGDSDPKA